MRALRLAGLALGAVLPGPLARVWLRLAFGYRIAPTARIGFAILDARELELGPGVRIGHLSAVWQCERFVADEQAWVGPLNLIRGGKVRLRTYSWVMRLNVLNAIRDHDCTTEPVSEIDVGAGAVIVSGHWLDFTDRITLGRNVILGGRNSSLWTHNRQQTAPIEIGDFCYLGSEIRVAPGAKLPERCIVALGSVLSGAIEPAGSLVGGVPAKVVRPLRPEDEILVRRKARKDTPDHVLA
jgi:acetyltransferase-like isoleucine patch superfamily enzyme